MPIDTTLLQSLPLFAALPADELRLLAERLSASQFADGALVLHEDDQCDEFYVVLHGQVDIIKALGTNDERLLAVRSAGTVLGELSLFTPGGRHTASVRANGPLEMLVMTRADFDGLLIRQPRLAYAMVQTLSLRLIESERSTIRDLHAKNEALAAALRDLQAAQAQLVEKEKLEQELRVARRIQSSLLPSLLPTGPGCDFGALMQPMSAVGGDFYDFVTFPDGRVGIAVGDVSDHGVGAALFMSMTVTLLRTAARRDAAGGPADPAEVLRSVNRGLLEFDMSGMFVTVLYGVFDPREREFRYVRAGHEQPVLHAVASAAPAQPHSAEESGLWIVDRSAWGTGAPKAPPARRKGKGTLPLTTPTPDSQTKDERRKTEKTSMQASAASPAFPSSPSSPFSLHPSSFQRGQALGIVPDPLLDVQRLSLPPQGVLLLDTDGAREAWDPAGSMFGEAGLRAALAEVAHLPAQAICQHIFERLTAFRGPAAQQDDVTLVVVKA